MRSRWLAKTGPWPIFGTGYEIRTQRVAFDVTNNRMKIGFCLNRKRLEPSLVEVTVSNFVVHQLPPFHMDIRDVLDEGGKITIVLRPEHHVPMVRHHTVAADSHWPGTQSLCNRIDEAGIVVRRFEERTPAHGSIEHMKRRSTRSDSMRT